MSYPLVVKKYFKDPHSYSPNPRAVSLALFTAVLPQLQLWHLHWPTSITYAVGLHSRRNRCHSSRLHRRYFCRRSTSQSVRHWPGKCSAFAIQCIIAAQIFQSPKFNDLLPLFSVCLFQDHWTTTMSCRILSSSSSVICQTTGPKPLPKRFLHIVRSRASSFNWQYPLLPLRSSSSFLHLLPLLLVTSICPFIFPSIICFTRQFLRKMWLIQLAFRFLISRRPTSCAKK